MISPDNLGAAVSYAFANSLTFAHVVGTGNMLTVHVGSGGSSAPTGVTYAGAALTSGVTVGGPQGHSSLWHKKAPASGTNNVVVTFLASTAIVGLANSWNGVNQTTPTGGTNSTRASGVTSINRDVVTVADDLVVDIVTNKTTAVLTPAGGQTQVAVYSANAPACGVSYKLATGTPTNLAWSTPLVGDKTMCAIALKPAPPPPMAFVGIGGLFMGATGGTIR